jgi:DNA-binding transcriptional LysR family regulator
MQRIQRVSIPVAHPVRVRRDERKTVELRRVRYFVAVAEELHFRRAAQRLHLAQPALSQQVRKLELELGVQLLHRDKRGVALTACGTAFLPEARRLLRQADEAARTAQGARDGTLGNLRVGHTADTLPSLLLRAFALFSASHPGVNIAPETLGMRRALEDVRAGRLDVAVVGLPAPLSDLHVTPLDVEGTVAAIADRHALSGRPSVPLERLADEQVVLLPRATNPAFFDGVAAAFRTAGIAPSLVESAEPTVMHVLTTVAAGLGIALLPSSAAERYSAHGVTFRPLDPPSPTTEIALVTRAGANETTVSAFLRAVRGLDRGSRTVFPATAPAALHAVAAVS